MPVRVRGYMQRSAERRVLSVAAAASGHGVTRRVEFQLLFRLSVFQWCSAPGIVAGGKEKREKREKSAGKN